MRSPAFALAALLVGLVSAPAVGGQIAHSPGPDSVSVTVYRAPGRSADEKMDLNWLNGFALISETRRVSIPAGESDIRFEAVAGGILPQSAIVTGLPDGVIEKNQDAYLLSPASLLDASLGRRVHIRRTSGATGEVTETDAVLRSGADGAVVLETPVGVEALRCSGLRETPLYDRVPEGLSAKPTLSVRVRSAAAVTTTVTLSYLASGFDWQANYVAELYDEGRRMDLFAWLTLANGDETSFPAANTQAVAGRLNRDDDKSEKPRSPPLALKCWPAGTTTSDLRYILPPPPAPPPLIAVDRMMVTAQRFDAPMAATVVGNMAIQEELGDLKLYRIPEAVTVAARSQKQVALLQRSDVPVAIFYRRRIWGEAAGGATPVITTRNRVTEKLGLPLPSGQIAFFERSDGRRILVGQGHVDDLAVGEVVEIAVGESIAVQTRIIKEKDYGRAGADYLLTVTNAKAHAIPFEAEIETHGQILSYSDSPLATRDGRVIWKIAVPANGDAALRYRLEPQR